MLFKTDDEFAVTRTAFDFQIDADAVNYDDVDDDKEEEVDGEQNNDEHIKHAHPHPRHQKSFGLNL